MTNHDFNEDTAAVVAAMTDDAAALFARVVRYAGRDPSRISEETAWNFVTMLKDEMSVKTPTNLLCDGFCNTCDVSISGKPHDLRINLTFYKPDGDGPDRKCMIDCGSAIENFQYIERPDRLAFSHSEMFC